MAATTSPSPEAERPGVRRRGSRPAELLRFDRGERILHWVNATLFAIMMGTASILYVPALSASVGRRMLVEEIHVYAGLALPVPIILTLVLKRYGAAFRADARRLNRYSTDDKRWLRTRGKDPFVRNGKFNAGQKLNAAFTAGAIILMLGTGYIMRWPKPFALYLRTGATFVHDWIYIGLFLTITGHVLFALNDSDARRSMYRGWIGDRWAKKHAPRWYEEMTGEPASTDKPRRRR